MSWVAMNSSNHSSCIPSSKAMNDQAREDFDRYQVDDDTTFCADKSLCIGEDDASISASALEVGDKQWDVSNLYSPSSCKSPPKSAPSSSQRRRFRRLSEVKSKTASRSDLYPIGDDVQLSMPELDMSSVDEIFSQSSCHSVASPRKPSRPSFSSQRNSKATMSSLHEHLQQPRRNALKKQQSQASQFTKSTLSTTPSFLSYGEESRVSLNNLNEPTFDESASLNAAQQTPQEMRCPPPAASTAPRKKNLAAATPPPPAAAITTPPRPAREAAPRYPSQSPRPSRRESSPPPALMPMVEIEVSPGIFLPLRGSQETMAAVNSGRAIPVNCMACQASLRCVPDCQLVLCPDCRILSPVEDDRMYHSMSAVASNWDCDEMSATVPNRRGVGLGLKADALY